MRLPVLLAVLPLAACAALPPPETRPLPGPLREELEAVRRDLERGGPRARARLLAFLAGHPGSVDGRRLLENLRLSGPETWRVYEEARKASEARPRDPAALYLLARVIPDREVQRDLLRRCLELDPSFFFANYGLGVVALEEGDPREAVRFARRAQVIRPRDPEAGVLLARALERIDRRSEAEEAYRRVLAGGRDRAAAVVGLCGLLARSGRPGEALEVLGAALQADPGRESFLVLASRLVGAPGVPDKVLERWERTAIRALRAEPRDRAVRLLRERARTALGKAGRGPAPGTPPLPRLEAFSRAIGAGEYAAAADLWEAGLRFRLLREEGNSRRPVTDRLLGLLREAGTGARDARTEARLARALSEAGFAAEAARVAGRALSLAPDRADLQSLAASLVAWDGFLREVSHRLESVARRYEREQSAAGLGETIERLGAASRRLLGRDVVRGIPVTEYPFVGGVGRTDDPRAPRAWLAHGALLVLGRRAGGATEGTLFRLVGRFPGQREEGLRYDLCVGEGRSPGAPAVREQSRFGGFTLPGWVVLDLDVLSSWRAGIRGMASRAREEALWPARDEERRRSLWFPAGVRARIARGLADPEGVVFATLAHERGHLHDAERFVPFLPHLPAVLLAAISHGFSPGSIEVMLEKDAQRHALLTCRAPRYALLDALSFLPYRGASPPHSIAYYDLVRDLVDAIADHPERFPSVDRRWNILEQLDRLTRPELADAIRLAFD